MSSLVKIDITDMPEMEWLKLRHPFIGSSESPTLLGEGYSGSTYWSIYHNKMHPVAVEADDAIADRMWWGKQLQHVIGEAIVRQYGWDITEGKHYIYDKNLKLGATVDFMADDRSRGPGIVESKNRDWLFFRDHYTDDKAHIYDEIQLAHQMMLHPEVSWGAIAVCVGGNDLQMFNYERADLAEHMGTIADAAVELWRRIDNEDEPSITFQDIPAWILARGPELDDGQEPALLPDSADVAIKGGQEPKDMDELLSGYLNASETRSNSEKQEKAYKAAIIQTMGDNRRAIYPGYSLRQQRAEIAEKVVAEADVGKVSRKSYIRTTLKIDYTTDTSSTPSRDTLKAGMESQAPIA